MFCQLKDHLEMMHWEEKNFLVLDLRLLQLFWEQKCIHSEHLQHWTDLKFLQFLTLHTWQM